MTSERIAELRETLRAANTPVWGVTDGKTVTWTTTPDVSAKITLALRRWLPRLLDEREALLDACRAADDALGNASEGGRFYAAAIGRVQAAIAKAESP